MANDVVRKQMDAINARFDRAPDFAVEKALRGELLTGEEYAHGTFGITGKAFELQDGGLYRLRAEARAIAAEVGDE